MPQTWEDRRKGYLYIYQNFIVKIFTSSNHLTESYILRIWNALAYALNSKHKIPRVIVLVIDDHIIPKIEPSEELLTKIIS